MSRATASDRVTDYTETGISLLRRLFTFTSTVSCYQHVATIFVINVSVNSRFIPVALNREAPNMLCTLV